MSFGFGFGFGFLDQFGVRLGQREDFLVVGDDDIAHQRLGDKADVQDEHVVKIANAL